jgi:hypothetical protein
MSPPVVVFFVFFLRVMAVVIVVPAVLVLPMSILAAGYILPVISASSLISSTKQESDSKGNGSDCIGFRIASIQELEKPGIRRNGHGVGSSLGQLHFIPADTPLYLSHISHFPLHQPSENGFFHFAPAARAQDSQTWVGIIFLEIADT